MRRRLIIMACIAVAFGLIGASVGASTREPVAEATCALPGNVPCLTDAECTPFGAICDVTAGACVCQPADLGVLVGSADLSKTSSDGGGGSGGGGGGSTGGAVGGFLGGGGMTSPPKNSGCSFAPGSR